MPRSAGPYGRVIGLGLRHRPLRQDAPGRRHRIAADGTRILSADAVAAMQHREVWTLHD
ncbi:hypothetical protein [Saccharopolyspora shandongensis]|uniref:hypothetical protein n=1 Tax=Saccharopolyspora shandongensis TaxID=418495 RepID=UPI0033DCCBB7